VRQFIKIHTLFFFVVSLILCSSYAFGARSDVEDFVTRFYQQCLGRNPDTPELNRWANALLNGTRYGADVANAFIFSQEFINRNTSNEDFVTILYRAFFDREPDSVGYNGHVNGLYKGESRENVFNGFIYSSEFEILCEKYGIEPFELYRPSTPSISGFISGRVIDSTSENPILGASIITDHGESTECIGDGSYFMELDEGTYSITAKASGYKDSKYVGITIKPNETTILYFCLLEDNADLIDKFVHRFYELSFNRCPDKPGFNGWVNSLKDGSRCGDDIARGFLLSSEFIKRNTSNEEFVTILYWVFFDRNPDSSGYEGWVNYLRNGASREDVIDKFIDSQEFYYLCDEYRICSRK